jgi:asparagine synthase (glutamine-hydrolysing)
MCGIAGIFNSEKSTEALHVIGAQMIKKINHRGPDGCGVKVLRRANGANVLLTHTRLSIMDLSSAGAQPMSLTDESLWIIFNGEIYNHRELREELRKQGFIFKSHTDTEVILAAYRYWGLDCFKHFVGMWALALWDVQADKLILSRDRLGIKPLYYAYDGNTWVFGSEPKVIVDQVSGTRRLNMQAITDYFSYRYVLGGDSFFRGIHSVDAGTHLILHGGSVKSVCYWELPIITEKYDPGENEVRDELESLLKSAVHCRMVADVPVGSFLSGGLDSSILVQLMAEKHSEAIKTFTIGFPEQGFNEFEFAREVASHCHTDHTEITLDASRYLDSLQDMLHIKDAPLSVPNEIALHVLSKELKKDVSVVLSGEGADELFGGYGRIFRSAYDFERVKQYGVNSLPANLKGNLLEKYDNLEWSSEIDHFLSQYTYMDFKTKENLFSFEMLSSLGGDLHNKGHFSRIWRSLDGMELHEKYIWVFQRMHLEGLLGRLDSATMSASVEGRVPFVDHRLVEYINALPLHYKLRWLNKKSETKAKQLNSTQISEKLDVTKYILRTQYKSRLPPRIGNRKKVGFPVPLSEWMSGPLRGYAADRLLSTDSRTRELFQEKAVRNLLFKSQGDISAGLKVWMLLNVEDWMRLNKITV